MTAIIPLANAYPSPAMSATQLLIMALVIVGVLAAWLCAVFAAAREPRSDRPRRNARRGLTGRVRAQDELATSTQPGGEPREQAPAAVADSSRPRDLAGRS